jgi:hypothetical protein
MNDRTLRTLTGVSGILTGALALLVVPLYFVYSGPPPDWNTLTRTLLSIPMLVALLVFFTGARRLIQAAGNGNDTLASLVYGVGLTYVAVTLVSESMEAGVPLYAPGQGLDPTIDGPLAAGMVLIHGPIARILTAVVLIGIGYAVSRTGMLPRWVTVTGYILAAVNLAFLPSLYFGMDPADFYAANGWGSTASISSVFFYWVAAVGIAVLRRRRVGTPTAPSAVERRDSALVSA